MTSIFRTGLRGVALGVVLIVGSPLVFAQADNSEEDRSARLFALCRLWNAVKYFHPHLAYRSDIDWDKALLDVLPQASAAKDYDDLAAAASAMLRALNDPATYVLTKPAAPPMSKATAARDPQWRMSDGDILLVQLRHFADAADPSAGGRFRAIQQQIAKARGIVLDLRADGPVPADVRDSVAWMLATTGVERSFASEGLSAPGQRRRMHHGIAPTFAPTSGEYWSGFYVTDERRILAPQNSKSVPIVFLINRDSYLLPVALGLQSAGKAAIVAEGDVDDSVLAATQTIALGGGRAAQIRLGELVYRDGSGGLAPDVTITAPVGDEGLQTALKLAQDFKLAPPRRAPIPASAAPPRDRGYTGAKYPSRELRLLGAYRLWAAIHYFHPYLELMEEDWDTLFQQYLPRIERAGTELEYGQAVAELASHIHDGHVSVSSPSLRDWQGAASPPFTVRMIEGQPVVVAFTDQTAAKAAGIEIGDVIVSVDGETAKDRMTRIARYLSSSTPQHAAGRSAVYMTTGPDKSTAAFLLRGSTGEIREVRVSRSTQYSVPPVASGEIVRILPGNIGYVDLNRLRVPMVDQMFESLRSTPAIIFDMRGYPQGTAWPIAPRLTERDNVAAAIFQVRVALGPDEPYGEALTQSATQTFVQRLPATDQWRYAGRTVMLIDGRTMSQAEHTGLFFRAANGTKFVGSPTAGANGDVTDIVLPGGVTVSFSGASVRHSDGKQLQRIGLVPDVDARPTISGIRAGKDEVLDAAIAYVGSVLAGTNKE